MAEPQLVKWEKPSPPSEQEAEAQLHQEGYTAFRWTDVPGSDYPKHRHEMEECIWVLSGEIVFEIGGKEFPLTPGDRLYLPSRVAHTARVPNRASVTYLVGQKSSQKAPGTSR